MDKLSSGFVRISNMNNEGQFGVVNLNTSHIEGLWNHLKKIKKTYYVYPCKKIIKFIIEAEYKFIIRSKSYDVKIKDFLMC